MDATTMFQNTLIVSALVRGIGALSIAFVVLTMEGVILPAAIAAVIAGVCRLVLRKAVNLGGLSVFDRHATRRGLVIEAALASMLVWSALSSLHPALRRSLAPSHLLAPGMVLAFLYITSGIRLVRSEAISVRVELSYGDQRSVGRCISSKEESALFLRALDVARGSTYR